MMLSAVFLLLYVTTSLRSSTDGIKQKLEFQALAAEAADLREQNRVYNTLKDEQLEKEGSASEQRVYQQLMSKLTLLQEEAKTEKEQLRAQALENENKEAALNQYQQIVRNIINANVLAKASIKQRDETIETKRQTIRENQRDLDAKTQEIGGLRQTILEKEKVVAANNQEISETKRSLDQQVAEVRAVQAREKTSKSEMEQKIAAMRKESEAKISELSAQNQMTDKQLSEAKDQLADASAVIDQRTAERNKLVSDLGETKRKFQAQVASLQEKHAKDSAGARAAFEKDLAAMKLSSDERAKREAEFAKKAQGEADRLKQDLAELDGKIKDAEGKLATAESAQKKFQGHIAGLEKEKAALSGDLEKSNNIIRAKKDLADKIARNFGKAGVGATVDPNTGDVTLAFGKDYFDTGKADLKPGMESKLLKSVPTYAETLLKDPKLAEKIASVEIIGFASPTYKGKLVDPESLNIEDQVAVNYNLDLSYNRAKSIFNYIFDTRKMQYSHQKQLLPLVKVTGRSYLAEDIKGRDVSKGIKQDDYCREHDCMQAQKVIIRFNLKD
ncbi:MAG TPA: hypothetical protein VE954_18725 [Oligoflexus sp.]|uniref:hypothetical protein n=1 Tax=Oligoflexus sp. TaxID=1971216 RepID=UPI002D46E498|nr:hypothetical protein [Oligoflexus sp.]HYX35136.1 hypothetical protein [Oligoflexus sp.]